MRCRYQLVLKHWREIVCIYFLNIRDIILVDDNIVILLSCYIN